MGNCKNYPFYKGPLTTIRMELQEVRAAAEESPRDDGDEERLCKKRIRGCALPQAV